MEILRKFDRGVSEGSSFIPNLSIFFWVIYYPHLLLSYFLI